MFDSVSWPVQDDVYVGLIEERYIRKNNPGSIPSSSILHHQQIQIWVLTLLSKFTPNKGWYYAGQLFKTAVDNLAYKYRQKNINFWNNMMSPTMGPNVFFSVVFTPPFPSTTAVCLAPVYVISPLNTVSPVRACLSIWSARFRESHTKDEPVGLLVYYSFVWPPFC